MCSIVAFVPRQTSTDKVADGVRCAWIAGIASRCAAWTVPIGRALAEAVAELREAATDHTGRLRCDLLGQQAGLHQGLAIGKDGAERDGHAAKAVLLVVAGADLEVMAEWVNVGIERSAPRAAPLSA